MGQISITGEGFTRSSCSRVSWNVKGETLMEYEITSSETQRTKRTLAVTGAVISVVCAVIRVLLSARGGEELAGPLLGLLGIGIILGLFVALLAFNTRLQVALDEKESREKTTI